jgi:hypothetical protein
VRNGELLFGADFCEPMFYSRHFRKRKKADISVLQALLTTPPSQDLIQEFNDELETV